MSALEARLPLLAAAFLGTVRARCRSGLRRLVRRVQAPLWHWLPHDWLQRLASPGAWLFGRLPRQRAGDRFARLHLSRLLSADERPTAPHHRRQWRQKVLEQALYFRNRGLVDALTQGIAPLREVVDAIERSGGRVILAPLHCVSDMAAALACTRLGPGTTWIVANHRHVPGRDAQLARAGAAARFIDPAAADAPARYMDALRAVREGTGRLVVFADAPPEITHHLFDREMPVRDALLFGHPARLHAGVTDMARLARAHLLVFALRETDGQLSIDQLAVLPPETAAQSLPGVIDAALKRHADQWLLWHAPSLFGFNSGRGRT